jgi:hypothetical protein
MVTHEKGSTTETPKDAKSLELAARRELALQATDAVSEVLETDVTVRGLIDAADSTEVSRDRLIARRALRAIGAIIVEDSKVLQTIGQNGIYHYTEGVINYGASDRKYFALIEAFQLTAEEATGLYALREQIAEQTNGRRPGFDMIIAALYRVGMSVYEAANDPDAALAAFDSAGYITDHVEYDRFDRRVQKQFDTAGFHPVQSKHERISSDDTDGSLTEAIQNGFKEALRRPIEEVEDESWRPASSEDFLKNLGL